MEAEIETALELEDGYRFRLEFDDESRTVFHADEPRPTGEGTAPNASRILSAAVGNCLSASLLFCLRKSKIDVKTIRTKVRTKITRNEEGYWRIDGIDVEMHPDVPDLEREKMKRCLEIFEKYCVVTASVRKGIPIKAQVL